jgi:drug/metabolite transporter (DMT)-like permease
MLRALVHPGTFLIFLAAMLWATDAPFRVTLLKDLSPEFVVLAEHFFNVVIVLPLLVMKRDEIRRLTRAQWMGVGIIAVGGSAIATYAFTQSFAYVNPSVAILLQKLQPVIAITLAWVFLRERLRSHFWIWAVLALAGAYVISFPQLVPRLYEGEIFNPNLAGVLLALLAAGLWAVSTVVGKSLLHGMHFTTLTALRFSLAFAVLFALNSATGSLSQALTATPRDWVFLLIVAFVSGAASLWMYYRGLRSTKASVATIAELGFPLAAMLINGIFLGERLQPAQIAGAAVLLLGVWRLGKVNADDADVHLS